MKKSNKRQEVTTDGAHGTCRNFQKHRDTMISFHNAITVIHTSTSIVQKALGNISNHHILMTGANSSY
jgi:hypothetical protein